MKNYKQAIFMGLLITPIIALVTQCVISDWQKIRFPDDPLALQSEVRHLTMNRSMREAKKVMEMNEFGCTYSQTGFMPEKTNKTEENTENGYLLCHKGESWLDWSKVYRTTIHYQRGTVVDVSAFVKEQRN